MSLKPQLGDNPIIREINKGRYRILCYPTENVMLCYKREMYLSFEDGRGETCNEDSLYEAMDKWKVKRVFFIYADAKIYMIALPVILSQGIQRNTEAEGKSVYSFPVRLLLRYNDFRKAEEFV